ncbi:MAG: hypothetical protein OXH64_07425 [Rhodospirillaceae bacterium]|nr:hypothetical protein [Rhodospirillaceae bacterium]
MRGDCLKLSGRYVTEGAKRLDIGQRALFNVITEMALVSIKMA